VPVDTRIRQIIANMERWRWLPDTLEPRHITVNVPDQSLDFVEDWQSLLHSRVIIGRKTSRTPILRTEVVDVVANPAWNVPDDIAARSIVPHLRQDANYLSAHNMVLANAPLGTKVDWVRVKGPRLPYQIHQNPGPNNGLGVIMLDSPNPYFVYMHDTPKKALFEESTREISNGCVRVEQIQSLASLVLGHDPADDRELQNAIASGGTEHLTPPHPVPVYMLYWTAVADADGAIGFRPDRYNRDSALVNRMFADSGERADADKAQLGGAEIPPSEPFEDAQQHRLVEEIVLAPDHHLVVRRVAAQFVVPGFEPHQRVRIIGVAGVGRVLRSNARELVVVLDRGNGTFAEDVRPRGDCAADTRFPQRAGDGSSVHQVQ
jgi:lipoprotein-anchoring transpeptidase ErfK/SrfK